MSLPWMVPEMKSRVQKGHEDGERIDRPITAWGWSFVCPFAPTSEFLTVDSTEFYAALLLVLAWAIPCLFPSSCTWRLLASGIGQGAGVRRYLLHFSIVDFSGPHCDRAGVRSFSSLLD